MCGYETGSSHAGLAVSAARGASSGHTTNPRGQGRSSESIGEKSEELLGIQMAGAAWGALEFDAMVRKMDALDPSFRD